MNVMRVPLFAYTTDGGFSTSEGNHMKTNLRTKIAASILIMGFAAGANAQVALAPGSSVFDTGGALQSALGTFALEASKTSAFTATDPTAFSGVLDSWVLSGDTNNPNGGLDFVYRVTNSITSNDAIHRMVVNGFGGFTVAAGYLSSGLTPTGDAVAGGRSPTLADRGDTPGDNAGFSFLQAMVSGFSFNSLNVGQTSRYLVLYTNASTYGDSMASVIDGSVASAATFAPVLFAPVPEPETYALMLAGLGLMGFVGRRRSKKNIA